MPFKRLVYKFVKWVSKEQVVFQVIGKEEFALKRDHHCVSFIQLLKVLEFPMEDYVNVDIYFLSQDIRLLK